jgi:AcrR family transcriptional regulator
MVKSSSQPTGRKRRMPQRAGSRETMEAIFEATARILQNGGRSALNTNRIAEKAGISIGTLYGYFDNKEAILLAMARRELDLIHARVAAALTTRPGNEPIHPVRRAIRALIAGYGHRSQARRILMETLFASGSTEEMARPVHEIAELIVVHGGEIFPSGSPAPSRVGLYVLTRAVDAVIRAATYDQVDFIHSAEFEDELLRLVMGYFSDAPAADGAETTPPPS